LDGVHPRFNEPVNGDVFAFHEAFADIVAKDLDLSGLFRVIDRGAYIDAFFKNLLCETCEQRYDRAMKALAALG
jgi:Tol biopolymer transport system component